MPLDPAHREGLAGHIPANGSWSSEILNRGPKDHSGFSLLEPTRDLLFPAFHGLMVLGVTFFETSQQTFDRFASRREDAQANHDEQDSLKNGEKEAENPQGDNKPSGGQHADFFNLLHLNKSFPRMLLTPSLYYDILLSEINHHRP